VLTSALDADVEVIIMLRQVAILGVDLDPYIGTSPLCDAHPFRSECDGCRHVRQMAVVGVAATPAATSTAMAKATSRLGFAWLTGREPVVVRDLTRAGALVPAGRLSRSR
jgi:hypothetical protein